VKVDHDFHNILTGFSLGIILIGPYNDKGYKGFWIYSQSSFDLLYYYNQSFEKIDTFEDRIIIEDSNFVCWLLSFQCFFNSKEHLQLQNKTKIFEKTERYQAHIIKTPFISFSERKAEDSVLIDIRTGKDILKENDVDIQKGSFLLHSYQNYLVFSKKTYKFPSELCIFKSPNLKKPIYKIESHGIGFYDQNMCFIRSKTERNSPKFDCYDLDSGKKTSVFVPSSNIQLINKNFFIIGVQYNLYSIYLWNSDYTSLRLLKSIDKCYRFYLLECFYSSLPFYTFMRTHDENERHTIWIHSKKNESEIIKIILPKKHDVVKGDKKSRIFSRIEKNNKFYLHVIDFGI